MTQIGQYDTYPSPNWNLSDTYPTPVSRFGLLLSPAKICQVGVNKVNQIQNNMLYQIPYPTPKNSYDNDPCTQLARSCWLFGLHNNLGLGFVKP